jgi:ligand-binding sensor domain-containing protein
MSLIAALPACAQQAAALDAGPRAIPVASGETVAKLDNQIWVVFQARDKTYWFGSNGQGVFRFDSKTLVRFTTEHGLVSNHIRGIQEDRSGNIYVQTEPEGVSKFDGRAFAALGAAPSKSEWKLAPDDLWFGCGQDTGAVYRYDGKLLHRLTFPQTEAGEEHIARHPRSKYPNAKYSPYDVYTIFKDSKGHVWFGTALLGACRYDGTTHAWVAKPGLELGSGGTRSIIEDKDGNFWFSSTRNRYVVESAGATEQGTVALRYGLEPGVGVDADGFSVFNAALKDRNGDLWLTTLGAGVWRYDGKRMTHYPVTHDGAPIWVYSIYSDREDVLWLGTHEHGVYKLNGKVFERVRL